MQILTLEELRRQREEALVGSEQAIRRHYDAYLALKKMVAAVNAGPLDVGEYYQTAARLGGLLAQLAGGAGCTLFHYFSECIDPGRKGDVRCFRMECLELAAQIVHLDQWRAARHRLRSIK
jgi:hypothetical protein